MNVATDSPQTQIPDAHYGQEDNLQQTALISSDDKICLIEIQQMPYLPDQQVELLHLQAEADALLLQLQAIQQKRHLATSVVSSH